MNFLKYGRMTQRGLEGFLLEGTHKRSFKGGWVDSRAERKTGWKTDWLRRPPPQRPHSAVQASHCSQGPPPPPQLPSAPSPRKTFFNNLARRTERCLNPRHLSHRAVWRRFHRESLRSVWIGRDRQAGGLSSRRSRKSREFEP